MLSKGIKMGLLKGTGTALCPFGLNQALGAANREKSSPLWVCKCQCGRQENVKQRGLQADWALAGTGCGDQSRVPSLSSSLVYGRGVWGEPSWLWESRE